MVQINICKSIIFSASSTLFENGIIFTIMEKFMIAFVINREQSIVFIQNGGLSKSIFQH